MHYLLFVLIPPDSPNIMQEVSRRLEPFNSDLDVEEYEEPCFCLESQIDQLAHNEAVALGFLDDPEESFANYDRDNPENVARRNELAARSLQLTPAEKEELRGLWDDREHAYEFARDPYMRAKREARQRLEETPDAVKPRPGCEMCGGTGKEITTYNPQGYFDYWSPGGIYSGRFAATFEREPEALQRLVAAYPDDALLISRGDVIPVHLLLEDCPLPFALLTPDGQFLRCIPLGRVPLSLREREEHKWAEQCHRAYQEHADCLAVVCDYHF